MPLKLVYNIFILLIIASSISFSQPRKVMERIATMKKVKMLDVLDLETELEEKVLITYNKYEKLLKSNKEKSKDIDEKLKDAIRDKNIDEIKSYTDEFLKNRKENIDIMDKKDQEFQKILSPGKFATYLIFEKRFREEIGKHLLKRRGR